MAKWLRYNAAPRTRRTFTLLHFVMIFFSLLATLVAPFDLLKIIVHMQRATHSVAR